MKPNCEYYNDTIGYCTMECAPIDPDVCKRCPFNSQQEAPDA